VNKCSVDNCTDLLIQQNTKNGSAFFYNLWAEYKVGYNDSRGNYWLGNDLLSQLTLTNRYKLRFDLQSRRNGSWYYAEYSTFIVQPESSNYRLEVSGYSGNAGDSFSHYNGQMFSTFDRDNDQVPSANCAVQYGGGFWYKRCVGHRHCCANVNSYNSYYFFWWGLPGQGLQSSRMWLQCK